MFLRFCFLLTAFFCESNSYLASCTEDSQCPTGFFCEIRAQYCRECLRCDQLKREAPMTSDSCVKSISRCGACLKGLLERTDGECTSSEEDTGAPHAYLPAYAWVAVALALLLMLITFGIFLKTRILKVISFSSCTSVHSQRAPETLATNCLPPPPYNYQPESFSPFLSDGCSPEIQRLVDSPGAIKQPSVKSAPERPREAAGSQAARVFNHPAYVRVPDDATRCNTPEMSTPSPEVNEHVARISPPIAEGSSGTSGSNSLKYDDLSSEVSHNEVAERRKHHRTSKSGIVPQKVEDSNNNQSLPEGAPGHCWSPVNVISGQSFVINVVENINNIHQRNEAHYNLPTA